MGPSPFERKTACYHQAGMCLFSHDTSSSKAVSGEEEVRSADSGGHVLWEVIILTVLVLCRLRAMFAAESLLS